MYNIKNKQIEYSKIVMSFKLFFYKWKNYEKKHQLFLKKL